MQGKGLRVAKKRAVGRYPKACRKLAVERLKSCDNIVALSEKLGVHSRLLYKWRDQLEPIEDGDGPLANSRERELRQQVGHLKRLVADKTLEADFSKVPCKKSWLDARAKAVLAGRHLRTDQRSDVDARQPEYRADVPA
jgi:transposase-like protein